MTQPRFITLDLLRGLAALVVVTRHFPWTDNTPIILPRSYLAVDLFFMLSGFVLTHAYQQRLSAGQTNQFLIDRLIRLYPLYLLATLSSAAITLAMMWHGSISATPGQWVAALVAGLFFLPLPEIFSWLTDLPYPLVGPAWSLFWELAINILFAQIFALLLPKRLIGILAFGAILLCVAAAIGGSLDMGASWERFAGGGARVFFAFFAGSAVCRWRVARPVGFTFPDWLLGLGLIATFLPSANMPLGWVYDVAIVALVFPVLILIGADAQSGPVRRRISHQLGYCSYGIYLLQGPTLGLIKPASLTLTNRSIEYYGSMGLATFMALTFVAASLATRWLDDPARAWLRKLGTRTPRQVITTKPQAVR